MIGQVIRNRYEITELIGEGGMAYVYKAHDGYSKKDVAVKILKSEVQKDPKNIERFQREVLAASSLNHKNIVEIYDVNQHNGDYYIVMEFVQGRTLKDLLRDEGALMPQEAVSIIRQLAQALRAAHKADIIHRDIKPQNVLIRVDRTVKLADFGIATILNTSTVTKTSAIVGSVQYISPEIVSGKKPSEQSDIYSLGILLYECLRGDVPFKGESPIQIAIGHISKPIPELRKYNSDISQSLENIVIKATAKKTANRYLSTDELINDLNGVFSAEKENAKKLVLNERTLSQTLKYKNTMLIERQTKFNAQKLLVAFLILSMIVIGILMWLVVRG